MICLYFLSRVIVVVNVSVVAVSSSLIFIVEIEYCKVPCIRPSPPMHDFDPKVGGGRLQGTTPLHGGSPSYIKR